MYNMYTFVATLLHGSNTPGKHAAAYQRRNRCVLLVCLRSSVDVSCAKGKKLLLSACQALRLGNRWLLGSVGCFCLMATCIVENKAFPSNSL